MPVIYLILESPPASGTKLSLEGEKRSLINGGKVRLLEVGLQVPSWTDIGFQMQITEFVAEIKLALKV